MNTVKSPSPKKESGTHNSEDHYFEDMLMHSDYRPVRRGCLLAVVIALAMWGLAAWGLWSIL